MNKNFIANILARARAQGIRFLLENDKLKLQVRQENKVDASLLETIKANRDAIKAFLREHPEQPLEPGGSPAIVPVERTASQRLPLSFAQERLWFIDQLQGSTAYHLAWAFRLHGHLDVDAFEGACKDIIERHEVLRTVIGEEEGIGYQVPGTADNWQLVYDGGEERDQVKQGHFVESFIHTPFDLATDLPLKIALRRLSDREHQLIVVLHHIAADAWSLKTLQAELAFFYHQRLHGAGETLAPLPIQYADYAIWQKHYYGSLNTEGLVHYWQQQLAGWQPLQLPTDHPRPVLLSTQAGAVRKALSAETTDRLLQYARQEKVTLYTLLLAAFKVLLHRYSGQRDICTGTPVAGRHLREIEPLIGFFVNTLVLRSPISNAVHFNTFLQELQQTVLDAFDHDYPFEKVVEAVDTERNLSHTPLFQVFFSLREETKADGLSLDGVRAVQETLPPAGAHVELGLDIIRQEEGLQLVMTYCRDLYTAERMERMLVHYENLLQEILLNADRPVEILNLLNAREEHELLQVFNHTEEAYPSDKSLLHVLAPNWVTYAGKTAVLYGREQLTYQELDKYSNRIARALLEKGLVTEQLVPICMDRSVWMVAAMTGILKAGGAYVPIDPAYPAERIDYILTDTSASIVLTTSACAHLFDSLPAITHCLVVDTGWLSEEPVNETAIPIIPQGQHLAYTMYTSGSTGRPKGVQIEHRSLVNFLLSMIDKLDAEDSLRMLAVTTYTFDIAGLELFMPLLCGGTVYIASREAAADAWQLQALLEEWLPTHMQATPATWQLLLDAGWKNKEQMTVLTGGEALPTQLKNALVDISGDTTVWNLYGPTETTIWSTIKALTREEGVTIGRPLANTRIYILNESMRLCPIGVYGELYIGGDGLARQYLNQPALTRERFLKDPFNRHTRLYKTGDTARWLPDGTIEFGTRVDDQLKIRGYRIEPGEIEFALQQMPGVHQAVVVGKKDEQGNTQLVAYIVPAGSLDTTHLRELLLEKLPEYMVPGILIAIDQLPLTANGKINRLQLASRVLLRQQAASYTAPRNNTEQLLTDIWQQLLGAEQIGIDDNFYSIGGHSLLAIRVVAAIQKTWGKRIPVRTIFTHATIATLAPFIDQWQEQESVPGLTRMERPAEIPLSYPQEQIWFADKLHGSVQFHMPWLFQVSGKLNRVWLEDSLRQIVARHEVLHTVIREKKGQGYQYILPAYTWQLDYLDARQAANQGKTTDSYITDYIARPFDLANDLMLRVSVVEQSEQSSLLILVLHHIAADAWTIGLLTEELMALYNGYAAGNQPALNPLALQYADFAIWQRRYLGSAQLAPHLQYWTDQLAGAERLELPTDLPRNSLQKALAEKADRFIGATLFTALQKLSDEEEATLFMTLLAAWKILLYRYTGQSEVVVGAPVAGRQLYDAGTLAGCFLNTMVLRSRMDGHQSFQAFLQQVKEVTLAAQDHQELPFEKMVEALGIERVMDRHPLFDVKFQLLNMVQSTRLELEGLICTPQAFTPPQPQMDISLDILQQPDGLALSISWNSQLYKASTINRLLDHYTLLLQSIVEHRAQAVAYLPFLPAAESHQLLHQFNNNVLAYEPGNTLVDLFEVQVNERPDAVAVMYKDQQLSYRELDERSNQLGNYLQQKGARADTLIGICLDRGIDMIVAILGILKAGAAYVPIDPTYPTERIDYILHDAQCLLLLTAHQQAIPASTKAGIIYLDDITPALSLLPAGKVKNALQEHHLAYVIYTSGSTGLPKGVMIEHRNVVNLVWNQVAPLQLQPGMGVLQFASFGFDASCHEIFCTLLHGGRLVMCDKETILDIQALMEVLQDQNIALVTLPPSYLGAVQSMSLPVKTIISAGEALNKQLATAIQERGIRLINAYGPTENTVSAILTDAPVQEDGQIVIGKPNANVQVYILDAFRQLAPIGIVGDLYLGGAQLARGYLYRTALTAERFMEISLPDGRIERLYFTGDKARWLADGNIEFAGRSDEQVKIRGFRVEPGEIEAVLQKVPGIRQCAVICKEDERGNKQLVAYMVQEDAIDKDSITAFLGRHLPDYMVPGILVTIDEIPLTPNGKVDKRWLAAYQEELALTSSFTAPRNAIEVQIAVIWADLLGVEQPGIDDNFFGLGGDSIITIQLVSRLRGLHYVLQVADVFACQTIRKLAALIAEKQAGGIQPLAAQEPVRGTCGLTPIQQWYLEQASPDVSHYNQAILLKTSKDIDIPRLQEAIKALYRLHDGLRFVYTQTDGQWTQQYGTQEGTLLIHDLSDYKVKDLPTVIEAQANVYQRSLDISEGELARFVLFQTPGAVPQHRLLIIIHHLVIDGVSWRLLVEDLELLLQDTADTAMAAFRKTASYQDWYAALVQYGQSSSLQAQLNYWQTVHDAGFRLPVDFAYEGPMVQADKKVLTHQLDKSLTALLLQEAPGAYYASVQDMLLAALVETLGQWTGNTTVMIGCESHGRADHIHTDTSHTIGWFTSVYPVLFSINDRYAILPQVKEQLRSIPDQGLGYGVLKYINKEASLQGNEPWEIVFNYLGQIDPSGNQQGNFTLATELTGEVVSERMPLGSLLELNLIIQNHTLTASWGFSTKHYTQATIARLADQYMLHLRALINHCIEKRETGAVHTPADFGLAGMASMGELVDFLYHSDSPLQGKAIEAIYPLSALQEGMLFDSLYDQTKGAYIGQTSCTLTSVNLAAFTRSWQILTERHTILRTGFYHHAFSLPVQCVFKDIQVPVELVDCRQEPTRSLEDYRASDLHKGFVLSQAPLMRITLFQHTDDQYTLLWTHHHLIFDGWSGPQLLQELLTVYDQLVKAATVAEPLEDRYEDYIRYVGKRDKAATAAYWKQYFSGLEEATLLPFIPAGAERTRGVEPYTEVLLELPATLSAAVQHYARQQQITINTLMQGVWAFLLQQYTGKKAISFGITVAGRPEDLSRVEERVGIYINTLPVHIEVSDTISLADWLRTIQQSQQDITAHQYVSLNTIKEWISWKGDLFDTIMVFQNYPVQENLSGNKHALAISDLNIYEQTNNFPLSVRVNAYGPISIQFIYKASMLARVYVENISGHFEQVLSQVVQGKAALPQQLQLLTTRETLQLEAFNHTREEYAVDITITDLFRQQAKLHAAAVAVVYEETSLTYKELDEASNRLARHLMRTGVGKGMLVPVCLDRGIDLLASILAIIKTGAAYVPVDPAYPDERIGFMLQDTGAAVVISDSRYLDKIAAMASCQVIALDACRKEVSNELAFDLLPLATPEDLAYVIYTSGSTGTPKGVMIEHKGVINLVYNQVAPLRLQAGIVVFQFASCSFDASCHEIFTTILHGGQLILSSQETILNARLLCSLLDKHHVNLVTLPPSYQSVIDRPLPALQTIISAGERLHKELALDLQRQRIQLINAYGPTENTVSSILTNDPVKEDGTVVIGRPLANVQAYILGESLQLLPVGVPGELHLGGAQLARGYLHQPALTAARFIQFRDQDGQNIRLYKTGDLCRWLPDGTIEFIGRKDDQVKIRGYRVEPGEIEHVLQSMPGIKQAAVILYEEGSQPQLAAGIVTEAALDKEAVVQYLKSKLPDYFVPAILVQVASIPQTPNNKTDKKQLKEMIALSFNSTNTYAAPRTALEERLAAIWCTILELPGIGIQDDFFEWGGHSIAAIRMIAAIRKELDLEIGIKAVFDHPTIAALANHINSLQAVAQVSEFLVATRPEQIPLSYAQERLWFIDQLQGSVQYQMSWIFRIGGDLQVQVLEQALQAILQRHEVLRTVIQEQDGIGYQVIRQADEWALNHVQQNSLDKNVRDAIADWISQPFDLSRDHMLRAWLLHLDNGEYILVVVVHHIAFDGWSVAILTNELKELYAAFLHHKKHSLAPLAIQYADYAIWQRHHLNSESLAQGIQYWKQQLTASEVLDLPLDYPRPARQGTSGGMVRTKLSAELSQQLTNICQQEEVTLFMLLLAVYKVLLYRYSAQHDIIVGCPVAGRTHTEVEPLIGFFVNTLAIRSAIEPQQSFDEFLQQLKATTLQAYEHQQVPFEKIVEALGITRDMSRSPLFQVMFALQSMPEATGQDSHGLSLTEEALPVITTKFDLILDATETVEGLELCLLYNTELFKEDTANSLLDHYSNLLLAVLREPQVSLERLEMITATEKDTLVYGFNQEAIMASADTTIVDLWRQQVGQTPDAIALRWYTEQITYKELDERSSQLARYLQQKNVQPGELVMLCLDRSVEMIVGILGILKAGCAYVPVDPAYPENRIKNITEDAGATVVITSSTHRYLFEQMALVINIDKEAALINQEYAVELTININSNDLCYVIFTSGSTGRPKGVAIEHQNLAASTLARKATYQETGAAFLVPSFAFDSSVAVIFGTLTMGGTLILCREDDMKDVNSLRPILAQTNTILCVPSYYKFLLAEDLVFPSALHTVIVAGEKLEPSLMEQHFSLPRAISLFNEYGPTESTVWSSIAKLQAQDKLVTIGKPAPHINLYILDAGGTPVPVQVPGEIYIGGPGVARGYLHQPALTAERFVEDPFVRTSGARMYRTGDRGRWKPDGTIEFLGRVDDQLKIRGYRVEPAEIEQVLLKVPGITGAAVVAVEDDKQHKRLVGFITGHQQIDKEAAQALLQKELPAYMIPTLIVLPSLPLTAHGKTDRRQLAALALSAASHRADYAAPRTAGEATMAAIWKQLLQAERVGVYDNFFELGGDSIISIQVVSRAKQAGYQVSPRDLFTHQTIAALSPLLIQTAGKADLAEKGLLQGASPLLPLQQWFFEQATTAVSHYNQSAWLGIDRSLQAHTLEQALNSLMAQHDSLRFAYYHNGEHWAQTYGAQTGTLEVADLSQYTTVDLKGELHRIANASHQSLDIEQGILVKAVLLLMPSFESHNRLLLIIHHLAVDGVSWRILLEDLEMILTAKQDQQPLQLPSKTTSYRQWYEALETYGRGIQLQQQLPYWTGMAQAGFSLPVDHTYQDTLCRKDMGSLVVKLDAASTTNLLQVMPAAFRTEVMDVLLAALAYTLQQWSGREEVVIGLEGHGREAINHDIDLSRTVGWFTTLYPLLLNVPAKAGMTSLIRSIKEQVHALPQKGLGYGVLKYINRNPLLATQPLPELLFNYLGQSDHLLADSRWLTPAEALEGTIQADPAMQQTHLLEINGLVTGGELCLQWEYSVKHYAPASIERIARLYIDTLQQMIAEGKALQQSPPLYTPSDFGLGGKISIAELDGFMDEPVFGKTRRSVLEALYPLSPLQEGILFHSLYADNRHTYVMELECEFTHLDTAIFSQCWHQLIKKHSILRTAFHHDRFGIPVQCVYKQAPQVVEVIDCREASIEIADAIELCRQKGLDPSQFPLMKVVLFCLPDDRYSMLFLHHHLILDGWSLSVLMQEFLHLYGQMAAGSVIPDNRADNYEDYIRFLSLRDRAQEAAYWTAYLQGRDSGTLLPQARHSAAWNRGTGALQEEIITLNGELTAQLDRYAQRHHLTINTIMQGAWSYLLHRYTDNTDILYGVTVSGRPETLAGMEQRVGMYINTVPLRSSLQEEQSIVTWLLALQNRQLATNEFQYASLSDIQQWAGINGALFDNVLVFENYPVSTVTSQSTLQVEGLRMDGQNNFPLTVIIAAGHEVKVHFRYNTAVLETAYVQDISRHFRHVLLQIINDAYDQLHEIELLPGAKTGSQMYDFQVSQVAYPREKTMVDIFNEQVRLHPDAPALAYRQERLTYEALNNRAEKLACYLQQLGVQPHDRVTISVKRSAECIIGILGILKAGAAYVPVDGSFPADRIAYILHDTQSMVYLADKGMQQQPGLHDKGVEMVDLREDWPLIESAFNNHWQAPMPTPASQAYIIYTSGSTGRPKGVMLSHQALMDHTYGIIESAGLATCRSFALIASLVADAGHSMLFACLALGSELHVTPDEAVTDGEQMLAYVDQQRIDCIKLVPSLWLAYAEQDCVLMPGKVLILGGEAFSTNIPGILREAGYKERVYNHYGPTETTIGKCIHEVDITRNYPLVPIGKPFSNTQLYIVDSRKRLCAPGIPGELLIGGEGIALGYLNLPGLTDEKFITDIFSGKPGQKLYRTGDVTRWLPDGNIEYLGRFDEQVKINGQRIELKEIESLLLEEGSLSQAIVLVREEGFKQIIAYVVATGALDKTAVTSYLKNKLPDYMIPDQLVQVDQIPLTGIGKVDRRKLLSIELPAIETGHYQPPATEVESILVEIWEQILGRDRIGIYDNFFEAGGNSLLVMRLVSYIKKRLSLVVPVHAIFQFPHIVDLAKYISLELQPGANTGSNTAYEVLHI